MKIDNEGTDLIDISYFDNICSKFKVSFSKEELKRLQKLFKEKPEGADFKTLNTNKETIDYDLINYKKLSYKLGLHKDSLNFIQGALSS